MVVLSSLVLSGVNLPWSSLVLICCHDTKLDRKMFPFLVMIPLLLWQLETVLYWLNPKMNKRHRQTINSNMAWEYNYLNRNKYTGQDSIIKLKKLGQFSTEISLTRLCCLKFAGELLIALLGYSRRALGEFFITLQYYKW